MKSYNIILFGPPGSGKGTQAHIISRVLNPHLITPGNIFRENIKDETKLGKKVGIFLQRGELVPNHITNEIVSDYINSLKQKNNLLFDGYPRNLNQAKFLTQALKVHSQKIDYVFDLTLPRQIIMERIKGRSICALCKSTYHEAFFPLKTPGICNLCGGKVTKRVDDSDDVINTRLNVYIRETKSMLDYLSTISHVVKIDSTPLPRVIFQQIYKYLK